MEDEMDLAVDPDPDLALIDPLEIDQDRLGLTGRTIRRRRLVAVWI